MASHSERVEKPARATRCGSGPSTGVATATGRGPGATRCGGALAAARMHESEHAAPLSHRAQAAGPGAQSGPSGRTAHAACGASDYPLSGLPRALERGACGAHALGDRAPAPGACGRHRAPGAVRLVLVLR